MSELEDLSGSQPEPAEKSTGRKSQGRKSMPRPKAQTERIRIPFGMPVMKMNVQLSEQFLAEWHPRWVNEENVFIAQQGGYIFVQQDEVDSLSTAEVLGEDLGGRIRQMVGGSGDPKYAYLMKCERDYIEQVKADHERTYNQPIDSLIKTGMMGRTDGSGGITDDSKVILEDRFAKPRKAVGSV